jgi:hypothetical protein
LQSENRVCILTHRKCKNDKIKEENVYKLTYYSENYSAIEGFSQCWLFSGEWHLTCPQVTLANISKSKVFENAMK